MDNVQNVDYRLSDGVLMRSYDRFRVEVFVPADGQWWPYPNGDKDFHFSPPVTPEQAAWVVQNRPEYVSLRDLPGNEAEADDAPAWD